MDSGTGHLHLGNHQGYIFGLFIRVLANSKNDLSATEVQEFLLGQRGQGQGALGRWLLPGKAEGYGRQERYLYRGAVNGKQLNCTLFPYVCDSTAGECSGLLERCEGRMLLNYAVGKM